jgi:carboxyl-terminal processing protease
MIIDRRAVLAGMAALAAHPVAAQQPASSQSDMRKMFDAFVASVETRFYRVDRLRDIDFRARADALWPQIADLSRPADAAPLLNALLAELQTSHMAVFTKERPEFYILADFFQRPRQGGSIAAMPHLGLFTAVIDGRHHVVSILEGRKAAEADVQIGDEVIAINNAPYAPVTALQAWSYETVSLVLRRSRTAATHTVSLQVTSAMPTTLLDDAMQESARVFMRGGKRIGYVHIWQLRTPFALARALTKIDGSRRSYRGADGKIVTPLNNAPTPPPLDALVVDNRVKIGGYFSVAQEFLSVLRGAAGGVVDVAIRSATAHQPAPPSFAGRCVMLIDDSTRSAAELFAQGFKNEKLGPVFGMRTAGAVSASAVEHIAESMILLLAIGRVTINGVDLEGVGVEPTRRVERPIPYSAGADPVLEAALDHLAAS